MENIQESVHSDVTNFERLLREKTNELQWKIDFLEATRKELTETRHSLFEMEQRVEEKTRSFDEVQAQLEITKESVRHWEEERNAYKTEQLRVQLNYESIQRERNSFMEQAKTAKLENMELRQKIQELEASNASRASLEESMNEVRDKTTAVINNMNGMVTKLEQDRDNLEKAIETNNKLIGRLKVAGMCAHATDQKYKMEIHELQNKLSRMNLLPIENQDQRSVENPILQDMHQMEESLNELKLELEGVKETERKFSAISEIEEAHEKNY